MTVQELIEALRQFPQEAEVYINEGPFPGEVGFMDMAPTPTLENDGRVQL